MPKPFTETERQQFLADKHVAVLSVAATDGRPPASVPIWYGYTPGGDIVINTGAGRRKARLIEQAGVVTLVVQREDLPYQYVIVEGTVVQTTTPAPLDQREAIAIRYLGEEGGRAFAASMGDDSSVLFTVRPDRWLTADYSGDL
ncbi:pyridoxamine 5'-phosphate oxidase family protein [Mycolicibacter arupensis]|uniref:Pyridoxamine 5-phosphate oxidase n=1 Tax=Mycolicibacter arupensis TaxID=342002 RepID=A0A0F5MZX7_9MYCO|nr:pyridoxamine 5'-phosphate oxidase family protein [Mycolicibacter arupensis]KKC00306.1 pyridoxamine 5-phosphate oxidase [Mycolicibacter arupensis]MCV7276410.1 pyridoxamine 5'-phosphate oxidase family protein [Mycolicibacter arupensis]ORA00703.1 pyridoxamine 5-phosphate oxidase [Mycolicibacter arupensis]